MTALDRKGTGKRIRQIRLAANLRQWELARLLGTTQSAVHKYEHGVVPEPRRLIELARVGQTSVEWILTGNHWENGSESRERLSPELLDTACRLREIDESGRAKIDEALRIIREAVHAFEPNGDQGRRGTNCLCSSLDELSHETLHLLESAARIHRAVLATIARATEERLDAVSPLGPKSNQPGGRTADG